MDLLKYTFFINLKERTDRLKHVESELEKLNIKGERVNAKKLENGAVGCTLSHISCLELAKKRGYPHVFICEDDIQFLDPNIFLDSLKKFERSKHAKKFDVLIIGGNNCPPYEKIEDYCIRISNCQTTTGYIVREHYYDTLITNFKDSAYNLMKNPEKIHQYALDMYWKNLQLYGNWMMIIPTTVVQYENYSDIEKHNVDYKHLMLDLDKKWLKNKMAGFTLPPPPSPPQVFSKFTDMFYCNKV